MIQPFEITAGGEDIAAEQMRALTSGTLNNIIGYRMGQIANGHGEAADDAIGYGEMMSKVELHFLSPIRDRTKSPLVGSLLRAAAKAAEKLAALCWAFADKIRRDPRSQQED